MNPSNHGLLPGPPSAANHICQSTDRYIEI
jgi:hypothetical protein